MSAINLNEINAELGDYHREHRHGLSGKLMLDPNFAEKFEILDDVTHQVPLPNITIGSLIKPADPVNFRPTADSLKFGARMLTVQPIKVDLVIVPQSIEKSWLGKMKNPSDPLDLSLASEIFDYILRKAKEELLLQAIYGGVYNANGTTAKDTLEGFLKKVDDEIASNALTPVVTGAITSANVIDKLEQVYDAFGEAAKGTYTEIKVNTQIFDWYNRRYRTLHGANTNYDGMKQGRIRLDGTNCEVVREVGLNTSQRIIACRKENMVMGVDSLGGFNFDSQVRNRTIEVMIDFKAGVEFKQVLGEELIVNDQA